MISKSQKFAFSFVLKILCYCIQTLTLFTKPLFLPLIPIFPAPAVNASTSYDITKNTKNKQSIFADILKYEIFYSCISSLSLAVSFDVQNWKK